MARIKRESNRVKQPLKQEIQSLYFNNIEKEVKIQTTIDSLGIVDVSNDTIKQLVECITDIRKKTEQVCIEFDSYARHCGVRLTFENPNNAHMISLINVKGSKTLPLNELVNLNQLLENQKPKSIDIDEIPTYINNWQCGDLNIALCILNNKVSLVITSQHLR